MIKITITVKFLQHKDVLQRVWNSYTFNLHFPVETTVFIMNFLIMWDFQGHNYDVIAQRCFSEFSKTVWLLFLRTGIFYIDVYRFYVFLQILCFSLILQRLSWHVATIRTESPATTPVFLDSFNISWPMSTGVHSPLQPKVCYHSQWRRSHWWIILFGISGEIPEIFHLWMTNHPLLTSKTPKT